MTRDRLSGYLTGAVQAETLSQSDLDAVRETNSKSLSHGKIGIKLQNALDLHEPQERKSELSMV